MTLGSAHPKLDTVTSTARLGRAVERLAEGTATVEGLLGVFDELSHSGLTGRQLPELLALKQQQHTLEGAAFVPSVAEFLVQLSRRLPHLSDGLSSQVMALLAASAGNPAYFGVVRAIADERLLDLGHPLSAELRQAFRVLADRLFALEPAAHAPTLDPMPERGQPIVAVSEAGEPWLTEPPLTPSKNLAIEAAPSTPQTFAEPEQEASPSPAFGIQGAHAASQAEPPAAHTAQLSSEPPRAMSPSSAARLPVQPPSEPASRAAIENLESAPSATVLRGGFAAALLVAVIGGVLWMLWSDELLRALGFEEVSPTPAPSATEAPSSPPTPSPSDVAVEDRTVLKANVGSLVPPIDTARSAAGATVGSAVTPPTVTIEPRSPAALAEPAPTPAETHSVVQPSPPAVSAEPRVAARTPEPASLSQPSAPPGSPREAPIVESGKGSAVVPTKGSAPALPSATPTAGARSPREQPVVQPRKGSLPSSPAPAPSPSTTPTAEQLLEDVRRIRDDALLIERKAREISRWIARSKLQAGEALLARLTPEHLLVGLPADQPVHPITRLVGVALENVALDSDDTRATRAIALLGRWAQHPEVGGTARSILDSLRRSLIIRSRPVRTTALEQALDLPG